MWRKRARGLASHLRDLNGALRVALSRFKAQLSGCTAPGRPKAPNQARGRRLERFVRLGNVPLHRMTRWERRLSAHCRDDLLLRREILSLGAASEKRTEKTWPRIPRITRKRAALNSGLRIKGSRRNKFPFWRERRAGRCEAPRRRRCRTSSRSGNKADARPPPRPSGLAARRPAGFVARSSHTAPGIARRSRLASGPGGLQQNGKLFLREPLALNFLFMNQATPPEFISLTNQ